jgi:hypothetical protein
MSVVFCAWLCVGVCTRVCVQYCVSVAKVYVCVLRVGVGACGSVCETWDKVSIAIKVSLYVCGDSECMSEVISGRGSRFSHTHTHTHTHTEKSVAARSVACWRLGLCAQTQAQGSDVRASSSALATLASEAAGLSS